jgi:hypothetical protein
MGKKSGSGSGMNNPDHISERLKPIFWNKILKFFDVDPDSGIRCPFWPLDLGCGIWDAGSGMGKKSGSGMNNPDHISKSLKTIFLE